MQPVLADSFVESPEWQRLSAPAQGVIRGVLELVIERHGQWAVDGSPKELCDWFGRELGVPAAAIVAGLRELDEAGYFRKGKYGAGNRFILSVPIAHVPSRKPGMSGDRVADQSGGGAGGARGGGTKQVKARAVGSSASGASDRS